MNESPVSRSRLRAALRLSFWFLLLKGLAWLLAPLLLAWWGYAAPH